MNHGEELALKRLEIPPYTINLQVGPTVRWTHFHLEAMMQLLKDRLVDWKHEHELMDFSDLIERCIWADLAPQASVLFVDEAQDLSPLQIAAVEMWAKPRCLASRWVECR